MLRTSFRCCLCRDSHGILFSTHFSFWYVLLVRCHQVRSGLAPPTKGDPSPRVTSRGFRRWVFSECFGFRKHCETGAVSVCFCSCSVDPPSSLIPSFLPSPRKKIPVRVSTAFQRPKFSMTMCDVHSVLEASRIVEEHPCLLQLQYSL